MIKPPLGKELVVVFFDYLEETNWLQGKIYEQYVIYDMYHQPVQNWDTEKDVLESLGILGTGYYFCKKLIFTCKELDYDVALADFFWTYAPETKQKKWLVSEYINF